MDSYSYHEEEKLRRRAELFNKRKEQGFPPLPQRQSLPALKSIMELFGIPCGGFKYKPLDEACRTRFTLEVYVKNI